MHTHTHTHPHQMFQLTDEDAANPDCVCVETWLPVMVELSTVIGRCEVDVRTRSCVWWGKMND